MAADGTQIYLDTTTGSVIADETLLSWRRAAVTGGLPSPHRARWQQLRAGVVNMWEFDAAEYWSADGRAQFVGRNEQGKSTMMAMTTLTMLTGDLSPRYVDTFGDSHRTFRYYLEPTNDPKDRRPTDSQLNRGWAWVEYGRVTDAGPQYFTTLLFVQARRTSPEVTKKWLTHTGPERVRDGITLLRQQAVLTPGDLPPHAGMTVHAGGTAYAHTVASTLFGFTDPERLRTVVELLKTLRTPKLGNRLNPDWVIDRIREALPPLDAGEVAELAEGWDQLGQLAADRDAATEAQEAVTAYIRSTWNPWADATLRLAADDLVAAVTAVDDVTRETSRAKSRFETASAAREHAQQAAEQAGTEREELQERRQTLLESQEYRDAAHAGNQVTNLTMRLRDAEGVQKRAREAQHKAEEHLESAQKEHRASADKVSKSAERIAAQAALTAQDAAGAGLPPESATWTDDHDTDRLQAAVDARRDHVHKTRKLAEKLTKAEGAAERETELLAAAEGREQRRRTTADEADQEFTKTSQELSDQLEKWAGLVSSSAPNSGDPTVTGPAVALREHWLEVVFTECAQARPTQRLAELVRDEWVEPTVEPLIAARAAAQSEAQAAEAQAEALGEQATKAENEPTPLPADPHNWQRRTRPSSSAAGAPLWELLDPVADLADSDLAGLEAALAGAGLLDAWVTSDAAWHRDRDGDEHVITLANRPPVGPVLRAVLTLADPVRDGGPLAALAQTVGRVLDGIAWRQSDAPDSTTPDAEIWVAADGSWATPTTTGRAAVPDVGASLLGASARAQERARRADALRREAEQHRVRAQGFARTAEQHRAAVEQVRALGRQAPSDGDVIGASRELATARLELERAEGEVTKRQGAVKRSTAAVDEANAALLTYAASTNLDPARLDEVSHAIDRAANSITALGKKAAQLQHDQSIHHMHTEQLKHAENAAGGTNADAKNADKQVAQLKVALQAANDALTSTAQELLAEGNRLTKRLEDLEKAIVDLNKKIVALSREEGEAGAELAGVEARRAEAEAIVPPG